MIDGNAWNSIWRNIQWHLIITAALFDIWINYKNVSLMINKKRINKEVYCT